MGLGIVGSVPKFRGVQKVSPCRLVVRGTWLSCLGATGPQGGRKVRHKAADMKTLESREGKQQVDSSQEEVGQELSSVAQKKQNEERRGSELAREEGTWWEPQEFE